MPLAYRTHHAYLLYLPLQDTLGASTYEAAMASRAVEAVSHVIMSKANITRFDNNLDAYMFDRLRKGAASSPSPPPRPYLPLPACVLCLPARSHTNSSSHAFLCQMIPRACSPCGWPRGFPGASARAGVRAVRGERGKEAFPCDT